MIIFIKKIKTKEGINSIGLDKIRKSIPVGFKIVNNEPAISYTANHIVVAFTCLEVPKAKPAPAVKAKVEVKAKSKASAKPKSKKISVRVV
jgi:hypothetical protein